MSQPAAEPVTHPSEQSQTRRLWLVELTPSQGSEDRRARELAGDAADLHLTNDLRVRTARGFLLEGDLDEHSVEGITRELLVEPVVEEAAWRRVDEASGDAEDPRVVYVLPRPGGTDPEAESVLKELRSHGLAIDALRTCRRYEFDHPRDEVRRIATRLLVNDAIEQVVYGDLVLRTLRHAGTTDFELRHVPIRTADDARLAGISRDGGLSLSNEEMRAIRDHFLGLERDPTDIELETIAQTWSEHCSHKTLAGRIEYRDESGTRQFRNMLRETIFAATETVRARAGDGDWCVSVFRDNAGIVDFDGETCLTFKVETHNRPSAIEPYGGANTGIGGVIRDTLGTGLGARPVCNTNVFCFAPVDTPVESLPPGVLHPRRIMKSVVSGVRDYGNRMGIPTVNGAVFFDPRYVGNPLVFCGNVGLIPRKFVAKQPHPGDLIVTIGGRTGRDGIHGATFSSAELTEHSEVTSGGAVQIGNAITEKMVADVLLQARDSGLYHAVTDCGAGGFSSAVGEMGESLGAEVWLERAPLKYEGLSYTEIWISEAQERMVLAVPESAWEKFEELCASESVEATVIGRFERTGRLRLTYEGQTVGELEMDFLHNGRPEVVRRAVWSAPAPDNLDSERFRKIDPEKSLLKILASGNVASKHWIIRQYDHEVLGGSVIKPLVGAANDGPSDAAVIRPRLASRRGVVIACGMNPYYGDFDPGLMAASAIDEAVRNCVAVGANPARIAILDNFCWGATDRPETLGALVRAALACQELAVQLGTPFISGKDSLHNEFSYTGDDGQRRTIGIPSTLLISAMGQIADVAKCVTMDFKAAGNRIFLIGVTRNELGGSHLHLVNDLPGGTAPTVDGDRARETFAAVHRAIDSGLVRACHDLSEGGLAVAAAEMAFAGNLGAEIDLAPVRVDGDLMTAGSEGESRLVRLFSESNSRFLCEIALENAEKFNECFGSESVADVGFVRGGNRLTFTDAGHPVLDISLNELKAAWLGTLDWN